MGEFKMQMRSILGRVVIPQIRDTWAEHLIGQGFDKDDVSQWTVEIAHVADEYFSNLMRLADVMEETDSERIPPEIYEWVIGTLDVSSSEIEAPMKRLEKKLEKHLPPDTDDGEEE